MTYPSGGDEMRRRGYVVNPRSAGAGVLVRRWRFGLASALAFVATLAVGTLPAGAAVAGRGTTLTIGVATLSPLVALIAGVLILVMPRLLNYIVAIYLIISGLLGLGLFGR
jgi:hypothetical protein